MVNTKQLKENPVLCIDTETGGFNPEKDALCSVSIMLVDGSNSKTWFIRPYEKNYDEKALRVNGLNKTFLKDQGVYLEEFALDLIKYCNKHFGKDNYGLIQLLGHNVSFDIGFIKEMFNNDLDITQNNKEFKYKDLFHYHFKDSMILANMIKDLGLIPIKQSISLKPLYEHLIGQDELSNNAHSSLADVTMSLEVYANILKKLKTDI